jgi:hypothetical protein
VQLIASPESLLKRCITIWAMEIPKVNVVRLECFERLLKVLAQVLGGMSDLPSAIVNIGVELCVDSETTTFAVQLSQILFRRTLSVDTGGVNYSATVLLEEI